MKVISKETIQRLPSYLRLLEELQAQGVDNVSSTLIAERFKCNPVQVRKDLSAVASSSGKPKTGFSVQTLIEDIYEFLGYDDARDAVLVGVGQLGKTLLRYGGFAKYGLKIVAGFDKNKDIDNAEVNGKRIFDISKFPQLVKRLKVNIGIITVPNESAQEVADMMVANGIMAIWNFSPALINVPQGIIIKNEDLAASLAILSQTLLTKLKSDNKLGEKL